MRRFPLAALFAFSLLLGGTFPALAQNDPSCADYDAWEWAQSVFESDPKKYDALSPDNSGEACPELPLAGFAPAFWLAEVREEV